MAGHDRKRRRYRPMRDRDAGIGWYRDGRRNTRHDLERQPILLKQQAFFAAAAEHKRIAALETHDTLAFRRLVHQQLIDIFLLHGMIAGRFAYIDILGIIRSPLKDAVVSQPVVYHDIGHFQAIHCLDADKPVVSGACAY